MKKDVPHHDGIFDLAHLVLVDGCSNITNLDMEA